MHLSSDPEHVWTLLTSDAGRASFWAERSSSTEDTLTLEFANGAVTTEQMTLDPPRRLELTYLGSRVTFTLLPDGSGGTDLLVEDRGVAALDRTEVVAGWLNVLFPLKAAADHGVDLRNHDSARTWDHGYADG